MAKRRSRKPTEDGEQDASDDSDGANNAIVEIEMEEKSRSDAAMVEFVRRKFATKACQRFRLPVEVTVGKEEEAAATAADLPIPRFKNALLAPAPPPDTKSVPAEQRCVCGAERGAHLQPKGAREEAPAFIDSKMFCPPMELPTEAEERDEQKMVESAAAAQATDAYGRINFYPADTIYKKSAVYVRVSEEADMQSVLELLVNFYGLCDRGGEPELMLSVVGSTGPSRLSSSRMRSFFNRGLVRALKSTHGWVMTSGLNSGKAKLVGEAVREGQSLEWTDDGAVRRTLNCLGVAPWNRVLRRDEFVNKDPNVMNCVYYFVESKTNSTRRRAFSPRRRPLQSVALNPYHTHFLLVDNGKTSSTEGIAVFQSRLERQLALPKAEGGLEMPVISLLIEGDADSLEHVYESVLRGTHVMICQGQGTGGMANLLSNAIERRRNSAATLSDDWLTEFKGDLAQQLFEMTVGVACRSPASVSPNQLPYYAALADKVIFICENEEHVSVFDLESQTDFDLSIMTVLLKSKPFDLMKQLKMTLKWNRADVASQIVFSNPAFRPSTAVLHELLEETLIKDQVEFVQLFINYGVQMNHFLTTDKLALLFQATISAEDHLGQLLNLAVKRKRDPSYKVTLREIGELVRLMTRRFQSDIWSRASDEGKRLDHPYLHLFLWALLLGRQELVFVFLDNCKTPLVTSVVGTLLCQRLRRRIQKFDEVAAKEYAYLKRKLEEMATGILEEAYTSRASKAMLLIHRPDEVWGGLNCMELAAMANDKVFLASVCCQMAIEKRYKGGFLGDAFNILLAMVFVFPIFAGSIHFTAAPIFTPEEHAKRATGLVMQKYYRRRRRKLNNLRLPIVESSSVLTGSARIVLKLNNERMGRQQTIEETDGAAEDAVGGDDGADILDFRNTQRRSRYSWVDKLLIFYSSPIAKFCNHTLWYFVYLIFYAYVILLSYTRTWPPSLVEVFLYFWQATFMLDSIRSILLRPGRHLLEKLADWFQDGSFGTWNRIDSYAYALSVAALSARLSGAVDRLAPIALPVGRLIITVNFVFYLLRIFRAYFANSYLGPKVIMMKRMVRDLVMFFMLLSVLMIGYNVATLSLIHRGRIWRHSLVDVVFDVLSQGVWDIFGELSQGSMLGEVDGCNSSGGEHVRNFSLDCALRSWPVPLFLIVYLFFSSILLVNMLIAIFTHVIDAVQRNSERIWKYEMYYLVREYSAKPILPPPFVVLELLLKLLTCCCRREEKQSQLYTRVEMFGHKLYKRELDFLEIFEQVSRADYLENQRIVAGRQVDHVVLELRDSIRQLKEKLERIRIPY